MKKSVLLFSVFILIGFFAFPFFSLIQEKGKSPSKKELSSFQKLSYFKNGRFQSPKPMPLPVKKEYSDKVSLLKLLLSDSHGPKKPIKMQKPDFSQLTEESLQYRWEMKDSSDQYISMAMRQIYEHSTISISVHGL